MPDIQKQTVRQTNRQTERHTDNMTNSTTCASQPKIAKKFIKPPILAFKFIQGHWICWLSRASVRLPISD